MLPPFSFLVWYFTGGLVQAFSSWMNILRFLVRWFCLRELLATLFSPWKRDFTPKTWRGFQPVRAVNRFLMNFISRFIGAIVRSIVITVGVVVVVIAALMGAGMILVRLLALPVFLWFSFGMISGPLDTMESVATLLSAVAIFFSMFAYASRLPESFLPKDRKDLFRKAYFTRVLGRIGMMRKEFRRSEWESDEALSATLAARNIPRETFDEIVSHEALSAERRARRSKPMLWENLRAVAPLARGWHYGYTPTLDRYSVDLSRGDDSEYAKLHLFGRDDEIRVASLVLKRPTQNSFLVVGDAGIGKKTFVHALVRKIREGDLPEFGHLRFLVLDLGSAVGDATNRGEDVGNFLRDLFAQATYAGNVVLVVENIDTFLGTDTRHPNLAPLFAEFLALPTFRVIGTIGTGNYHALVREDESVLKFFEEITLKEPDGRETLRILLDVLAPAERYRAVFTWSALSSIVELSGQYEWDVPYPEKAIDLAQETLLHWQSDPAGPFIMPETVSELVAMKTGIPTGAVGEDEKARLLRLEEVLHERIVGQDEAIRQVSEALRRARVGFGNPKRPLGSFLFLGPTGVGKTETAKALAEAYFGSEERMVRIDMSEFQGADSVERLIGSSVTNERGQLIERMEDNPFSVLLLDEIEKAYPGVLDLFLSVLDEGFVTDGFGKKISFRKSIIIATSNASSALIADLVGRHVEPEKIKKDVIADIARNGTFRMEFMNRFDSVVFFAPLLTGELLRIVAFKLTMLAERIKKEKNITLSFTPESARAIVERGYEPEFGARSLNRYIEDHIEDMVVRKVLEGSVAEGGNMAITAEDLR